MNAELSVFSILKEMCGSKSLCTPVHFHRLLESGITSQHRTVRWIRDAKVHTQEARHRAASSV